MAVRYHSVTTMKEQNTPNFSDIEKRLPAGWVQIAEGAPVWQITIIKAAVYQAFYGHYRELADAADEEMRQRFNDERFTEARRDYFAARMAFTTMEYIHSQIDRAMYDAARLVMIEAFNRLASIGVEAFGADDTVRRLAPIPKAAIEEKALNMLRARLEAVPFSGKGPKAEWTPHELRIAILDAMAKIENVRNRIKWRVAAGVFNEDPKTKKQRNALTSRLNKLLTTHGVDYTELEAMDDRKNKG